MWNSQSKEMWSTHDLACAHCRARKIRCGRERPQCESCKRDGVECRYSSPGKRINHVKLLCQNFEALEDQLNSIQGDLSALTSLVKSGNVGRSAAAASSGDEWALEDFADGDGSTGTRKDRHIVRNEAHSIDRYHGPCSLFTLCREFHDDAIFNTPSSDSTMDNDVTIRMLLQEMCADASKEEHLDIPSEHAGICLPPRQFLTIVVGQFFKNADYATDIFVQSNFQMQLDRVYAHPLSPADEAWAVCFNVIVLLAIGKDQNNQSSSPFIQPFLQTLRMAVNNPRVFLAPRLVNVQALALLSHIAEQYSPPGFAEIVFAQACLLARTMGLHQSRAASEGLTPEEVIEKHKVFRSLYIRDKNIAICRGSSSWLPTYDSSISPLSDQLNDDESKYAPRIELARIQDEVYRHFHSAEAPSLPPSKHFHLLSRFEQKLERWATTHRITQKSTTSPDAASLMLSFFATRLCVFRGSDDQRVAHQAFKDAKASCIIFLLATTSSPSPDPNLTTTLDQLLNRKRSPTSSPFSSPEDSCCDASHDDVDGAAATAAMSQLTASFPLAALFLVAKNVFGPITPGDDLLARTEEEILLLEALRDRYAAITDHDLIESFTRKLSRTLDTLVRIVRQKRYPEAANTPSMIFNDLASLHSSSSSRKDTPSGPDTHSSSVSMQASATADVDAVPSSSLLLPFMQPLNSSSPSPCFGSTNNIQWQSSYKQQVDSAGRVGKRPRLASQSEMFDITTAFADRPDDDQFSMFDFLGGGNDIPVFEGED